MSVKPENTFIQGVHKHLPSAVYRMKNNNPYVAGIPDCWYSGNKGDLWIEYKFIPRIPVRSVVTPNLSALQRQWLQERYKEGRNVCVVIGCKEGGVFMTNLDWERELQPVEFRMRLLDRKSLAALICNHVMENNHGDSIRTKHLHDTGKVSKRS